MILWIQCQKEPSLILSSFLLNINSSDQYSLVCILLIYRRIFKHIFTIFCSPAFTTSTNISITTKEYLDNDLTSFSIAISTKTSEPLVFFNTISCWRGVKSKCQNMRCYLNIRYNRSHYIRRWFYRWIWICFTFKFCFSTIKNGIETIIIINDVNII